MTDQGYQYVSENGFIEASHIIREGPFSMDHFHSHNHYELYYLIEGSRKYIIDGKQYEVEPGDLVLIGSQVAHRTIESGYRPHQRFLLTIHPFEYDIWPEMKQALDLAFFDKHTVIPHHDIVSQELRHIMERIIFLSRSNATGTDILIHTLVIQMLVYIARYREKNLAQQKNSTLVQTDLVSRAVSYIEKNYYRHFLLSDMANDLYISSNHLSRVFKANAGITLNDYLNDVRVEKARVLLLESNLSLKEIAEKTGFGSISQFNRQIKRRLQLPPLQYRLLYETRKDSDKNRHKEPESKNLI